MPRERAVVTVARRFANHMTPSAHVLEFETKKNRREPASIAPECGLAQVGKFQLWKQDLLLRIGVGGAVGSNDVDEYARNRIDALGEHAVVDLAQPGEFLIGGDACDRGEAAFAKLLALRWREADGELDLGPSRHQVVDRQWFLRKKCRNFLGKVALFCQFSEFDRKSNGYVFTVMQRTRGRIIGETMGLFLHFRIYAHPLFSLRHNHSHHSTNGVC